VFPSLGDSSRSFILSRMNTSEYPCNRYIKTRSLQTGNRKSHSTLSTATRVNDLEWLFKVITRFLEFLVTVILTLIL